jgi:N-acetylneuraminate synthase
VSTQIIAEVGVNHNGSMDLARQLVDVAVASGSDVVKFQSFRAAGVASKSAPRAEYQIRNTGDDESQYDMLKRLELSDDDHAMLIEYCADRGIEFLSTPFDLGGIDLLVGRFHLPLIKLGSSELTNAPILVETARTGVRIILSTGMGALAEVHDALGALAFGYTRGDEQPSRAGFAAAFADPAAQAILRERVALLHCTTEYPAPPQDINLRAMNTLRDEFGLEVGFSDHSLGIEMPIAAVAMGATIIEKHITLDRSLPGPDHAASLEPVELTEMVRAIRHVEAAMGDGIKRPSSSELKNMPIARKSVITATAVRAGEPFTVDNLTTKRPGDGRSPFDYYELLGTPAGRDYEADEVVD